MKWNLSKLILAKHTLLLERLNAQNYRYDTPAAEGYKVAYESLESGQDVNASLHALKPWRKGPFTIHNVHVNAEWDCAQKWSRMAPLLPPLEDKTVLDVGGGNGYFTFECAKQSPRWAVCLDPSALYTYQFKAAQLSMPDLPAHFFPLGWQDCDVFENECDVVLCMGVLYHHTDPHAILKACKQALKKGGVLILETIIIPGDSDVALCPQDRYAAMRNVYYLPTLSVLKTWCKQLKLEVVDETEPIPTTENEQRSTEWSSPKSIKDFLDPNDATKTIEGYPAPQRVVLKLVK
jgi:tRNA (mo5U34)-methyltransferase